MPNPDLTPQEPTVQRVGHIREVLRKALWNKELFVAYCLSGRRKKECKHIVLSLYDDYLDDYEQGLLGQGKRIRQHELLDAVYQAHLDEVSEFKKEYFASMVVLNEGSGGPALSEVQQRVVEEHAFPLLPADHPDRMALVRLLGEELGEATARELSSCWHTDDVARVVVDITQHHPERLDLRRAAERRYYSVFLRNAPESARTGGNNYHQCLDKICRLRGIDRPKRNGGRRK